MATYEQVHAGDRVLGHDNNEWTVVGITHDPQLEVVLERLGRRVTGWPPEGTHVNVVRPSDTTAEHRAAGLLLDRLGAISIISETWESDHGTV